ncbi:hypothetical protein JI59_01055 [Novosphingobium pentaromativorans US6-1]|nr:hypothetical protein JI59_01055 [Novosphingobium pentaromativorans US6-1]
MHWQVERLVSPHSHKDHTVLLRCDHRQQPTIFERLRVKACSTGDVDQAAGQIIAPAVERANDALTAPQVWIAPGPDKPRGTMCATIPKGADLPLLIPQDQNRMVRDFEHYSIAGMRDVLCETGDQRHPIEQGLSLGCPARRISITMRR